MSNLGVKIHNTMTAKKINFCAGPAIMPQSVFEQAAQAVVDYQGRGLSLLEISHRTAIFDEIIEGAKNLVRELGGFGNEYEVLFLTGGASMQFPMVPYNLLPADGKAAYLDTGRWSIKAIKEAKLFGHTEVIASSAADNYTFIPKNYKIEGQEYTYAHITTNNTVAGTQMHQIEGIDVPIVADMSSDIFSRPLIQPERFGLIYAGAQKNIGAAGTTLVIVRKDMLGKVKRHIPSMLNYETHIKARSIFNTPPVFPIYCSYLTLQWIKEQGLHNLGERNKAKADLLYGEIDRNVLLSGRVANEDRSLMNATFLVNKSELDQVFLDMVTEAGCMGIKGHRSMGGFRVSMYNAMDIEGVQVMVDVMQDFEQKYG